MIAPLLSSNFPKTPPSQPSSNLSSTLTGDDDRRRQASVVCFSVQGAFSPRRRVDGDPPRNAGVFRFGYPSSPMADATTPMSPPSTWKHGASKPSPPSRAANSRAATSSSTRPAKSFCEFCWKICDDAPYRRRLDSRTTSFGAIRMRFTGAGVFDSIQLTSNSAAVSPINALLWSIVESGTLSRSE